MALLLKEALARIGAERRAAQAKDEAGRFVQLDNTAHDTREEIARAAGVGTATIARFERVRRAVEEGVVPRDVAERVARGEESIGSAGVAAGWKPGRGSNKRGWPTFDGWGCSTPTA